MRPFSGCLQARDGLEERRLAGARRAEDGRDMGAQRDVELEGEWRERQAEAFERKRHTFVRRFNQTSERKIAPNASDAETARRRVGTPVRARLHVVVDRGGDRRRTARDVPRDEDRRSELAERARKGENESRGDSARGQRKRDGRENARFARPERPSDRFETRVHLLEGDARRAHEERKRHDHHRDDDGFPGENDVHAEKGPCGASTRATPAQELQEQEPGRDGRQDEGKRDERLEERLPGKAPPREEQREREPEGREEENGESCHPEREPDDGQVHGELGHRYFFFFPARAAFLMRPVAFFASASFREAEDRGELPPDDLGDQEVEIDTGIGDGARECVPEARPVVSLDEKSRDGGGPEPLRLRRGDRLLPGDRRDLDDGGAASGLPVTHRDFQADSVRGERSERFRHEAWMVPRLTAPESDLLDGDGHGRLLSCEIRSSGQAKEGAPGKQVRSGRSRPGPPNRPLD